MNELDGVPWGISFALGLGQSVLGVLTGAWLVRDLARRTYLWKKKPGGK